MKWVFLAILALFVLKLLGLLPFVQGIWNQIWQAFDHQLNTSHALQFAKVRFRA